MRAVPVLTNDHGPVGRHFVGAMEEAQRWQALCELTPSGRSRSLDLRRAFHAEQVERLAAPNGSGPTALLINDTDGRVNIGCRLTSVALKRLMAEALPGHAIGSLPFTFRAAYPASGALSRPFVRAAERTGDRAYRAQLAAAYGPDAARAIADAALIVFQPEGTIDQHVAQQRLEALLSPLLLARALGKPVLVVNGTIPAFDDHRDAMVRRALELADALYFRDAISPTIYGGGFLADCALTNAGPILAPSERDACLITTGARNSRERNEAIARAGLKVCAAEGLVPLVLTKRSKNLSRFRRQVERAGGIFAETTSIDEAKALVSRCALHVGGRYHMTILAAVLAVPTLLHNVRTQKNEWLASFLPSVRLLTEGETIDADLVASQRALTEPLALIEPLRADVRSALERFSLAREQDGLEKTARELDPGALSQRASNSS